MMRYVMRYKRGKHFVIIGYCLLAVEQNGDEDCISATEDKVKIRKHVAFRIRGFVFVLFFCFSSDLPVILSFKR